MKKQGKKYTSEEKYSYHTSRDRNFREYGLKPGSSQRCYSAGFADGFEGLNQKSEIERQFGKRPSGAYAFGHKRGRVEARKYFLRTGKRPSALKFKLFN